MDAAAHPIVTVIMANYNGSATIASCLHSVLAQSLAPGGTAIEVLVVDDASSDDSVAVARAIADADPRVRVHVLPANGGPAVARNLALDHARGAWLAVVDSDDLIHPERLARLVATAQASGAEIVADNLLVFDDAGAAAPYAFMPDAGLPRMVGLAEYVAANAYGTPGQKLGYLKPLFRTDFVRASGVRYRPELRVAQDFGFVLGLLGAGARLQLMPGMLYFYRKHGRSNSHRLQPAHVEAMLADDGRFLAAQSAPDAATRQAFALRRRGFVRQLAFGRLVQALKDRRWAAAVAIGARHPGAAAMLRQPLAARLTRAPAPPAPPTRPQASIVTCRPFLDVTLERLTGLAAALGRTHDVHLVIPVAVRAPRRLAIGRLPGMDAFASLDIRSGRSSPFVPGDRWAAEDQLFVAQFARPHADLLITEWQPGVDIIPYALRPGSLSLILAGGLPAAMEAAELAKLARANAVLTFHAEDAAVLYAANPATPVVLLPGGHVFGNPPMPLDGRLAALLGALAEG